MDPQFTVSVLTENDSASLSRLVACLGRHRVKIESFTCTNGDASKLYQHTVVVRSSPDRVRRAVKQIGAAVGVLEVSFHRDFETHERQVALFKLSLDAGAVGKSLGKIVRTSRARILIAGSGYVVVEKTGSQDEIEELSGSLEPFGVMEFVRSGSITVTKPSLAQIDASADAKNGG